MGPGTSGKCSEVADGVTGESEGCAGLSVYLLYDKLYRKDVLRYAYDRCKANKGAPGWTGRTLRTSKLAARGFRSRICVLAPHAGAGGRRALAGLRTPSERVTPLSAGDMITERFNQHAERCSARAEHGEGEKKNEECSRQFEFPSTVQGHFGPGGSVPNVR